MVNFAIVGGCTWSFGILLPEISERFNASATQVAWLPAIASFIRLFIGMPLTNINICFGTYTIYNIIYFNVPSQHSVYILLFNICCSLK